MGLEIPLIRRICRQCIRPGRLVLLPWLCLTALVLCVVIRHAVAQVPEPSGLDLGIIVVPTRSDIDQIVNELHRGRDFSVLAKERSIDATAVDGGYLGKRNPDQLRTELRGAIAGRKPGQLSDIVELPTGFAVLKIFNSAPPLTDLNPKRISSLIATGAIRYGASLSGQVEANAIMQQFPKPEGWNRDLYQVCTLRKQSLVAGAIWPATCVIECATETADGSRHDRGPNQRPCGSCAVVCV